MKNPKIVISGGFQYLVDVKQKVQPNDYCYMSPSYNDGKKGFIIKISDVQTYPKDKSGNEDWSEKEDGSVYNVEALDIKEIAPNVNDNKVYPPNSYHLSHCNSHGSGKVIASDNSNLGLPTIKIDEN
jgi:hypothetical protein